MITYWGIEKELPISVKNLKLVFSSIYFENQDGFITRDFFDLDVYSKYKFSSGPFTNRIFQILSFQKNRIKILMGDIKTTIKNKEFLFTPA